MQSSLPRKKPKQKHGEKQKMKMTWKNKSKAAKRPFSVISRYPNLPFDQQQQQSDTNPFQEDSDNNPITSKTLTSDEDDPKHLASTFQAHGDQLAQDGKYREALGKWEAALTLMPESAVLHEQKAQVLLELGDAWSALKAATRSTELEPSWPEAWITLGRAQLNFGEPDSAIESFDKALALKPGYVEAQEDQKTALNLVKRRKQLHSSGLSAAQNRFVVGDKTESS